MSILVSLCTGLEKSPLGLFIAGSTWAFPTIETFHVLFLVVVVGMIAIVDLRLLGVASRDRSVSQLSTDVLPPTWGAFAGAVVTGGLLFSSKATHYLIDWSFRFKMILLALAGLNMLIFHVLTYRDVRNWDDDVITPPAARIAGALSLLLWIGVVALGRWIGFTVR